MLSPTYVAVLRKSFYFSGKITNVVSVETCDVSRVTLFFEFLVVLRSGNLFK
jgi:hypothetical protein